MSSSSHDSADPPEVRARIDEALAIVPIVVGVLKSQLSWRARRDDLASYGNEGALTAARGFDPGYGVSFARWATFKIRMTIIDSLRVEAGLPRRLYAQLRALEAATSVQEGMLFDEAAAPPPGSAAAADARLTDHLAAMATAYAAGMLLMHDGEALLSIEDPRANAEEELARKELTDALRAAIAERPDDERVLLERYYFEGATMAEASGGLSRSWSSRLHARAVRGLTFSPRLRKAYRDQ